LVTLSGEGVERLHETSKKRQEQFLAGRSSRFRKGIAGTVGDPLRLR
jgi:hypothetical protein